MENDKYTFLQIREIFHLEFLRWFGRKVKSAHYAVKGGVNLRLFFKSFRYSEDIDIDVKGISVIDIQKVVLDILTARSFISNLKPFGVDSVVPPNMVKAKQTETTQRFKVHLIAAGGEDLFTKIEFSRRGFLGEILVQAVSDEVLRAYKLTPLLVPHYDVWSAITQKVLALAARSSIQARDIFDLYVLNSQYDPARSREVRLDGADIKKAHDNIFEVSFEQFRDTVLSYLSQDDQVAYASAAAWDEIKLKVAHFVSSLRGQDA